MIAYPEISPYFLKIGNIEFRWYGLMYALAFVIGYFVLRFLLQQDRFKKLRINDAQLIDLLFFILLGVILGGRLGYVLFYNLGYYLENPLQIFAVWQGGMSFHGGLLGVALAGWWFCKKQKIRLLDLADLLVLVVPIGLGLGRIGNFINGELYGRVTDVPWCMEFPNAAGCRHPSQLYEFLLEGVILFAVLWWLRNKKLKTGHLFWTFVMLYGVFRFIVEFFRQPDANLGFIGDVFSMGQLLSLPMIVLGIVGLVWGDRIFKSRA